ncbi:zinc finger CCCH domain-containing protein 30 [Amborella trichopoda]|uniref:zinc finger CCCH domain-containing protein 30 n=1 Tax=Amborella trichopoda TaxID=13333 RepID=UPI0005D37755|nr:zinc finger CCCH domain-containing protein 30 [Amborella trichopoda]|eukprot:XP_011626473.1 zinc finger CCCH domain-containing protein 30 [Amborella trichopoda]
MALYGRDWKQRFLMHSTNKMATQHKPKRVSWASEGNLCQVRLFLSEDPPTHAGSGAQDLLQAKASWLWHSTGTGDELPPGFETSQPMWHPKGLSSVKWRYPPRFMINPSWKVAAGEESREVEVQNQRQFKVLEAVYPRPSSIPPSPSDPSEPEEEPNSHHPPLIPITPIEDEDPSEHLEAPPSTNTNFENPSLLESLPTSTGVDIRPPIEPAECNDLSSGIKLSSDGKPISMSGTRGTEPDVAAAASAAFTAILKSKEEGSLIDPDLLIRILSNPKLIEKFLTEHGKGGAPVSHANLKNPTIIPMIHPPTTSKPHPPVQTSPATFPANCYCSSNSLDFQALLRRMYRFDSSPFCGSKDEEVSGLVMLETDFREAKKVDGKDCLGEGR